MEEIVLDQHRNLNPKLLVVTLEIVAPLALLPFVSRMPITFTPIKLIFQFATGENISVQCSKRCIISITSEIDRFFTRFMKEEHVLGLKERGKKVDCF